MIEPPLIEPPLIEPPLIEPPPIEVVAAALVRDGRVLAARRSPPHRFAGRWEFPGGKLEPGEDAPTALVRECREELGTEVVVGPLLQVVSAGEIRLALYGATTGDEPLPLEDHDELRWVGPAELGSIDWLPIDVVLLPVVESHLREGNREGRL